MSPKPLNENDMWQAVVTNDGRYDGAFVYAVRTTGVFCRPSCASRTPQRTNVEFFPSADDATRAGYRACKRCQPDAPHRPNAQLVIALCRYIEAHIEDGPISLGMLAEAFNLSQFHLQRVFKREMGVTPREYADALRFENFKKRLRSADTVTDAIYAAGYTSSSQLYSRIDDQMGMTPSEYQAGGSSVIGYAVAESPIGTILVAATTRGICAVRIGDDAATLLDELRTEFPSAQAIEPDDSLEAVLGLILSHLAGDVPRLDLPLDLQATAFQKRVWGALRDIPYGETRTYADIARAIQQPNAARAVGNACGKNPVALAIPCHRVVKSDGEPGHYRWGAERKKRLLAMEQDHTQHQGAE